ncbi:MAG: response regulator transcription factor [Pseudonocardia sp.]
MAGPPTVLVVGGWPAATGGMSEPYRQIVRCEPRLRACQLAMSGCRPDWLVLGEGLDDDVKKALMRAAQMISPAVCVAVLTGEGDPPDFDRWLRRGCRAYLPSTMAGAQVLEVLQHARIHGVAVVDMSFQATSHGGRAAPIAELTRREQEVLRRVRLGLRNREIAAELTVSGSTVDFHVRNLLLKLGARNRVEAVTRARAMGL